MKKLILFTAIITLSTNLYSQVGIGTENPAASAILDMDVSSYPVNDKKGFLPPRMTAEERMSISSPAEGLMVYNTTDNCINFFNGLGWVSICDGSIVYPPPLPLNIRLGGSNAETLRNHNCVEQTSDGGYIFVATSSSSNSGDVSVSNHGGQDVWLVKLNSDCAIEWNMLLGGSGNDTGAAVQETSDGGFIVAAHTTSSASGNISGINHGETDMWVIKLDAVGNIIWEKLLGGSGLENVVSIRQISDGGYIVTADTTSSASGDVTGISHGGYDFWVVKLDANGNMVWNELLGGNAEENMSSFLITPDGNYVVVGYTPSSASGDVSGTNHGDFDLWIVKLDENGNIIWDKLLGGSNVENGVPIQNTPDQGFIIVGHAASSSSGDVSGVHHGLGDTWILKLDSEGNKEWDKLLGSFNAETGRDIKVTLDGNYIITSLTLSSGSGDLSGINHGSVDYWTVKLDSSGNIIWDKLHGGSGNDTPISIFQHPDGSYLLFGHSAVTSVGNGDQTGILGKGDNDIWIIRLDENGEIIE